MMQPIVNTQLITLYCKQGSSDKVYGLALILEDDGSASCVFGYGARGAVGKPTVQHGSVDAMLALFNAKMREKSRTYKDLTTVATDPDATLTSDQASAAIAHILAQLGGPYGHPALRLGAGEGGGVALPQWVTPEPPPQVRVRVSHVMPLPKHRLDALLVHPDWGVTAKMNGRRCIIEKGADGTLRAYNRTGGLVAVPAAAERLVDLPLDSFIVDGEAMDRNDAGAFYMFDYLERNGQSLRSRPYRLRIALLETDCRDGGLIERGGATPERGHTNVVGLGVLTPAMTPYDKAAVLAEVAQAGGEGIVLRNLDGPSVAGDTRFELKWKLKGEMDVVVLEHQLRGGMVTGTFVIGVQRVADGAWIALGNANTGLTQAEFAQVKSALQSGERVVLRIEFLTARTVGISPVEPVVVEIRTDKAAVDCTTAQLIEVLGEDRESLIAAAPRWVQSDSRSR